MGGYLQRALSNGEQGPFIEGPALHLSALFEDDLREPGHTGRRLRILPYPAWG